MGLMRLLLVGAIGGGAAYLYKNREARQAAMSLGKDVMDTGLAMMPEKYADMASKVGLRRVGSAEMRPTDLGTELGEPYTGPSQINTPL